MKSALEQAKAAARGKDVRISGGAQTIHQFLKAGLVDEFTLHIAPVIHGAGVSLFDHLSPDDLKAEQVQVMPSPFVTHVMYRIKR
jgi:dihydrofolate reductase